jgi:hypothetical protein
MKVESVTGVLLHWLKGSMDRAEATTCEDLSHLLLHEAGRDGQPGGQSQEPHPLLPVM